MQRPARRGPAQASVPGARTYKFGAAALASRFRSPSAARAERAQGFRRVSSARSRGVLPTRSMRPPHRHKVASLAARFTRQLSPPPAAVAGGQEGGRPKVRRWTAAVCLALLRRRRACRPAGLPAGGARLTHPSAAITLVVPVSRSRPSAPITHGGRRAASADKNELRRLGPAGRHVQSRRAPVASRRATPAAPSRGAPRRIHASCGHPAA